MLFLFDRIPMARHLRFCHVSRFYHPYSFGDKARRAVSICYGGSACSTILRPLIRDDDPFAMPHYLEEFRLFRLLFTERLRWQLRARRLARSIPRIGIPKKGYIRHGL
jgi:hypothetical protein